MLALVLIIRFPVKPSEPQPTPSTCTPDWQCGAWNSCSASGAQTRTCTDANACNVNSNKPIETQGCTQHCTPNWYCSAWSLCTGRTQTRSCSDANSCGTTANRPDETSSCTCAPVWQCSAWSVCGTNGTQTRTCADAASCGINTTKPLESQSCTPKIISNFGSITVLDVDYSHNGTFSMLLENTQFDYAISVGSVTFDVVLRGIQAPRLEHGVSAWYIGNGTVGTAGNPFSGTVRIDYYDPQSGSVYTTGTVYGIRS